MYNKLRGIKFFIPVALLLSFFLTSCSTVPITGRKQLALIPSSQMLSMSQQQYSEVKQKSKIVTSGKERESIKRVGQKLSIEVEKWLEEEGYDMTFNWEFELIESKQVNAWCMPGGKVAFYTGIMKYCNTDTAVAVVMGHEIAHAVCKHGNERMTMSIGVAAANIGLLVALKDQPSSTRNSWMLAFGAASTTGVLLPFSRKHETEADELGLMLMARAGYDPRESVRFWQRMHQGAGGSKVPEFLSTHPSHQTRIENLQKLMPKAILEYNKYRRK